MLESRNEHILSSPLWDRVSCINEKEVKIKTNGVKCAVLSPSRSSVYTFNKSFLRTYHNLQ